MLARDLSLALDEVAFARACGIDPDPWQQKLLSEASGRALLLCARQTGKSTVTALKGLHKALYRAPALVLLLSPAQRQSAELFRKVVGFWRGLEGAPEAVLESVLRLELTNGSRVVALPATEATIRGYSAADMIVIDEAARCPDSLIAAARPMLATTGGDLIALSTPAGKRGWFYEQWHTGKGWTRYSVTADQCPRISPEFLEDERRELGELMFKQEYQCEFFDSETAVFPTELIDRAFSDEVEPLWGLAA